MRHVDKMRTRLNEQVAVKFRYTMTNNFDYRCLEVLFRDVIYETKLSREKKTETYEKCKALVLCKVSGVYEANRIEWKL